MDVDIHAVDLKDSDGDGLNDEYFIRTSRISEGDLRSRYEWQSWQEGDESPDLKAIKTADTIDVELAAGSYIVEIKGRGNDHSIYNYETGEQSYSRHAQEYSLDISATPLGRPIGADSMENAVVWSDALTTSWERGSEATFSDLTFSVSVDAETTEEWHRISTANQGDLLISAAISAETGRRLQLEVLTSEGLAVQVDPAISEQGDHHYWQIPSQPGDYYLRFQYDGDGNQVEAQLPQTANVRVGLAPLDHGGSQDYWGSWRYQDDSINFKHLGVLTPGESVQQQNYLVNSEAIFENSWQSSTENLRYDSWGFDLSETVLLDTTILQDILQHKSWYDDNDNGVQDRGDEAYIEDFTNHVNVYLFRDENDWWNGISSFDFEQESQWRSVDRQTVKSVARKDVNNQQTTSLALAPGHYQLSLESHTWHKTKPGGDQNDENSQVWYPTSYELDLSAQMLNERSMTQATQLKPRNATPIQH